MTAYLDNSATTPVCSEAVEAMKTAVTELWGNPSSLHQKGIEADEMLENARSNVARRLFCRDDEVYFTSGGTESNNLAVQGAAHAMRRRGRRIVTTSVEHPSIDETVKHLENEGFEVIRLGVDKNGRISERELFEAVTPDTILVSIMAVNNETGTIQPVEAARTAVTRAKSPALVHCDAVQAFGKLPLKPAAMGVDLMTVSSHKIHGPKGVGALYVKKGVRLSPIVFGGSQEEKLRPGTQPMPAIAGFGAAAAALPNLAAELKEVTELLYAGQTFGSRRSRYKLARGRAAVCDQYFGTRHKLRADAKFPLFARRLCLERLGLLKGTSELGAQKYGAERRGAKEPAQNQLLTFYHKRRDRYARRRHCRRAENNKKK